MASNSGYLDDGKYTTESSLSVVGSRATVLTQDLVVNSTLSVGGATTFSSTTLVALADGVGSGSAIGPTQYFTSEASLGLYRSAASQMALSYGTFNAIGLRASSVFQAAGIMLSSATTAQSASTAKVADTQFIFSVLSLTTNGAALFYRSGNSTYSWPSSGVIG